MTDGHGAPGHSHDPAGPGAEPTRRRRPATWLLLALVRCYQTVVSPWLPPSCKYYPSCSAYAVTALQRHGALKGAALSAWRLLRCNPWSKGGVDHVPPRGRWSNTAVPAHRAGSIEDAGSEPARQARTLGAGTWGARPTAPQDR